MTALLMWYSCHLVGKKFPITHKKQQLISTCTFPVLNLSFHYDVVYQIVQSCICKEYSKNMQFMATSPYYNPTTYTSSESLRNIQFTTVSRHTIIMKTSTIYHKISSGLAHTLVFTKVMAREMAMILVGSSQGLANI